MEGKAPLKLNPNYRAQALEAADLFSEIAAGFPDDTAANRIITNAKIQLRKCYALTPGQELNRVLKYIDDHTVASVADIVADTWWGRKKVESLLAALETAGRISGAIEPALGDRGGRPRRVYRLKV